MAWFRHFRRNRPSCGASTSHLSSAYHWAIVALAPVAEEEHARTSAKPRNGGDYSWIRGLLGAAVVWLIAWGIFSLGKMLIAKGRHWSMYFSDTSSGSELSAYGGICLMVIAGIVALIGVAIMKSTFKDDDE
jgi:uncharacterized membrane protein YdcZ (DUF606 family)